MTAAERQTALERISIRFSIANLRTFPCVSILEGKGKLSLHGAWFDISTGELWVLEPDAGDFSVIASIRMPGDRPACGSAWCSLRPCVRCGLQHDRGGLLDFLA